MQAILFVCGPSFQFHYCLTDRLVVRVSNFYCKKKQHIIQRVEPHIIRSTCRFMNLDIVDQ